MCETNKLLENNKTLIKLTVVCADDIGDIDDIKQFNREMVDVGLTTDGLNLDDGCSFDLEYSGNISVLGVLKLMNYLQELDVWENSLCFQDNVISIVS